MKSLLTFLLTNVKTELPEKTILGYSKSKTWICTREWIDGTLCNFPGIFVRN